MNIPFPIIYPRMIMGDWFNADQPYDDDAELTRLEEENKRWLDSIGKQYMKPVRVEKPAPPPAEEAATDDNVFLVPPRNEAIVVDSEDSREVEEEEEEEEIPISDSPPENDDEEMDSAEEATDSGDADDGDAPGWPYVRRQQQ